MLNNLINLIFKYTFDIIVGVSQFLGSVFFPFTLEALILIVTIFNLISLLISNFKEKEIRRIANDGTIKIRRLKTIEKAALKFLRQYIIILCIWHISVLNINADPGLVFDLDMSLPIDPDIRYFNNDSSTYDYTSLDNNFVYSLWIHVMKFLIMVSAIIFFFQIYLSSDKNEVYTFEYTIFVSLVCLASLLLLSTANLLTTFLVLELQGLSVVLLAAYNHKKNSCIEASLKYFMTGAVGSGLFIFGASFIYSITGSLNIYEIIKIIGGDSDPIKIINIGIIFMLAGIFYKLTIVPFHQWAADVYQGVPPITATFFATIPKIAVIGFLIRLIDEINNNAIFIWLSLSDILFVISIISISVSLVLVYNQEKIQRFFLYSSVVNAGYVLFLLAAFMDTESAETFPWALITYLIIYVLTMLNVWFLHNVYLYNFSTKKHMVYLKELSGMGKLRKMISVLLSINIFSLLALPPLGGFIGKMYFAAFLAKINPIFTFLFLLFGVISALYYLRLIKIIWFDKYNPTFLGPLCSKSNLYISVSTLFLILFWIYPDFVQGIFINNGFFNF